MINPKYFLCVIIDKLWSKSNLTNGENFDMQLHGLLQNFKEKHGFSVLVCKGLIKIDILFWSKLYMKQIFHRLSLTSGWKKITQVIYIAPNGEQNLGISKKFVPSILAKPVFGFSFHHQSQMKLPNMAGLTYIGSILKYLPPGCYGYHAEGHVWTISERVYWRVLPCNVT